MLPGDAAHASAEPARDDQAATAAVSFADAFRFWLKLGFINFGGPAGQIAIMHRELVEQKRWVSEPLFLRALNFSMLLPGPEATELAIYIAWRMHGIAGGIVAGAFFVIPSIFVLLGLSWLAVAYTDVPVIRGLLYGVQPVVMAIVLDAVLRVGRRTLRHRLLYAFAIAAFVALFFLRLPFPPTIGLAALGALVLQPWQPAAFQPADHASGRAATAEEAAAAARSRQHRSLAHGVNVMAAFLGLWLVPLGALYVWRGGADTLVGEMWFFTQAAFVTFGGAYAVLSYIADVAVNTYGWLTAAEMVRGLGLAESTPGPLIMVTEYVGFVAAWKNAPADMPRLLHATLGGLITVYATFLPTFLFIFLGAPYIEWLSSNRRLQAALTGVTAAVVGVIANLAVFFGMRVLFPESGGFDAFAAVLATAAFAGLRRFAFPTYWLVPVGALAGMFWVLLGMR
ncbi:MAG: chromate efflux transporter [Chloroflexi bacterium]|nr:chromate efflux transporter [Chloroflexota bacterium]